MTSFPINMSWYYGPPMFIFVVSSFVWYFRDEIRAKITNWRKRNAMYEVRELEMEQ